MSDRRGLFWLFSGVAGLALGLASTVWDVLAAGVVAGACALAAGVAAYRLVGRLGGASTEIETLEHQVSELALDVEREATARRQAEAATEAAAAIEAAASTERGRAQPVPASPDVAANALNDPETGLHTEAYFNVATDARIASARRHLRPVALVLMDVMADVGKSGGHPAPADVVAHAIRETLRESDTACRLREGGFGLLLEDTPENGAIWTVERLRRHLTTLDPQITMWAGIACYPAHGFSTNELLGRCELALAMAKEWPQDRIEVATGD